MQTVSREGRVSQFFLSAFLLLLILALPIGAHLSAQRSDLPAAKFDKLIAKVLKPVDDQGPGVAIYVNRKGGVPYQKVIGEANLEYGIPLTEHSVFDLASVAKQFTGMAIAKLLQAGKLSLTDDVRKYLPEVPDFGAPITLAHLLHHTSGLRDVGELYRVGNFGEEFTAQVALRMVSRQKALNFLPGSEHDYSNTGYVLLALVVERITGQSFVKWCRENIFLPLDMKDSFANDNPDKIVPGRAVAYNGVAPGYSFRQDNGMSLIGASSVFASLNDMIKWMGLFGEQHSALREIMTTRGKLNDGTPVNYGFGLSLVSSGDRELITHSGATPAGFRTLMAHLPEENISIVILSNWGNLEPIPELAWPIISLLLDEAPVSPEKQEPESREVVPGNLLQTYTGKYLFNQKREVGIVLREGQLFAEIAGMEPAILQPYSSTEFFLPPMNSLLVFEVVNGEVSRVIVREGEQKLGELRLAKKADKFKLPTNAAGSFYSEELDKAFAIEQQGETLHLVSAAHGSIPLRQLSATTFNSTTDVFSQLNLRTSPDGDISSFTLDLGSRARSLYFKRWNPAIKK